MLKINLQLFSELNEVDDFDFGFDSADFGSNDEVDNTPVDETTETEEGNIDTDSNEEVQQETNDTPPEVNQPFLNIKYNKQDMALSQEEAVTLAQKGMNYDKLLEKLNQVESNPGLQYLNELAQRNGTSIDEMVNHWKQVEEQQKLDELVQANIPEEYAREMLESRKFREQMVQKQKEEEQQSVQRKEFDDFISQYPNVDPKSIPQSVWEANENGIPLRYAYQEYELNQLRNENKVLKTQSKNKQKAPINSVSMFGGNDSNTKVDPFLQGFDSI